MLRKLFLLVLLVAFCAIVFYPLAAQQGGIDLLSLASLAKPSNKPLPRAWSGSQRAGVSLADGAIDAQESAPAIAGSCPAKIKIQKGDSLSVIARRCGISLANLLAANPQVSDPNRVYAGQEIAVYGAHGGGDPQAVRAAPPAGGYLPGAAVVVAAGGFAPGAQVKVGIGLPGTGFHRLGVYSADDSGQLVVEVNIPSTARTGERCFFLLTSSGIPVVQVVSDPFVIGE
jgi:LysM repeat protein